MDTQINEVINFLKSNPDQGFTAKEIAINLSSIFKEDYKDKSSKFDDYKDFIQQISAEIGAQKKSILKKEIKIEIVDKPRPRKFYSINKNTQCACTWDELLKTIDNP